MLESSLAQQIFSLVVMGIVRDVNLKLLCRSPARNEGAASATGFLQDSQKRVQSFKPLVKKQQWKLEFCCNASLPELARHGGFIFSQVEIDPEVLFTSLGASATLFSACALVAWMQKSGFLPAETPVILSQVAFRILIPCYLMSKVARVLATQATGNVGVIPLIAIGQVLAGALIAKFACMILYGSNTTISSKMLAKKEALVTTGCAFGNALSLPLVFLNGILPPQQASLAAGYLALYVVGWSPALWTIAYQILKTATGGKEEEAKKPQLIDIFRKWYKRIVNPPLIGILAGTLIGLTPLSYPIFHQKTTLFARLLHPVYDAVTLLGSAAPAVQVIVLACSLAGVMKSRSARLPHFWGPRKLKATGHKSGVAEIDSFDHSETSVIEGKELIVILCVRSLIIPLGFSLILTLAERLRLLVLDPICKLTLMVLSVMPSAQNLVVLAQLRSSTRPLAKELASLMLIQYTVAALIPVPIWLAIFLSMTNLS